MQPPDKTGPHLFKANNRGRHERLWQSTPDDQSAHRQTVFERNVNTMISLTNGRDGQPDSKAQSAINATPESEI